MHKDVKEVLIVIAVTAVIVGIIMTSLMIYSGMSRPLTVVESKSMQHSDDTSYLGIIDTGDMVVMISPDKSIVVPYVEGYQTGHSSFGSYGDVIIYYRDNGKNPVIHRAIIWLDVKDGVISAPALQYYPADRWESEGTWNDLTGILTLKGLPYKDGTKDVSIDLSKVTRSGYLTKGDNNTEFDQTFGIHPGTVMDSELKAVAGLEVPWLGCIKLLVNNKNVSMIPQNSLNCLWVMLLDIVAFVSVVIIVVEYLKIQGEKEEEEQEEQV